jgi:hypothetical protein
MSPGDRQPYLEAVDAVLLRRDFKRRKSEFEWKHRAGPDVEWIHLNFGLGVINPSVGVIYEDLASSLPRGSGARYSVARMLASLSGASYSSSTPPAAVAADIEAIALPALDRLRDRAAVLSLLAGESPKEWPVSLGASDRMRLLPLLLAESGRINEALERLRGFEAIAAQLDRAVPDFTVYAERFRARYAN